MKKTITLSIFFSTLLLASCSLIPQTTAPAVLAPAPEDFMAQFGTIEGGLGYPSEWIPPNMEICAKNTETQETICTRTHIKDPKYYNQTGYMLKVPAGSYTVTANLPQVTEFHGLYSEFVPCGLRVECPSHELITVTVAPGQTVSDINPIDWYSN